MIKVLFLLIIIGVTFQVFGKYVLIKLEEKGNINLVLGRGQGTCYPPNQTSENIVNKLNWFP